MKLVAMIGFCLMACDAIAADSRYLFVWAADADKQQSDFVAVVDANPASEAYGKVLATVEVGLPAVAHHSEHRMPAGGHLFVNGFESGHSFVVDLRDPMVPRVVAHFTTVGQLSHAHSFERLPSGNVLATFQNGADGARITGGIAKLDPDGSVVGWASAARPGFPDIRPYSLAVLPEIDRALTTSADMWGEARSDAIQVWQISDLSLKHTLRLLPGPQGDEQFWPMEPRLMPDGETLLVNTAHCGLYEVFDVETNNPSVDHIYSFKHEGGGGCSLPAVAEGLWIQTVRARNGLVSLDVSDPSNPREVAHLEFPDGEIPHWVAIEPNSRRIVVTGFGKMLNAVKMVVLDPSTGALEFDRAFGDDGTLDFGRTNWPHGTTGAAIPHGSVFSVQ